MHILVETKAITARMESRPPTLLAQDDNLGRAKLLLSRMNAIDLIEFRKHKENT
jgi:hypothetical protein